MLALSMVDVSLKAHHLAASNFIAIFIIAIFAHVATALTLDVDNGVLGTPEVDCARDFVHFKVATKKPFRGRVYVKGEFGNPKCVHSGEDDADQQQKHDGQEQSRSHGHLNGKDGGGNFDDGSASGRGGNGPSDEDLEGRTGERPKSGNSRKNGAVPEGEEEEESAPPVGTRRTAEGDEDGEEETIRQILQELQRRRNGNADNAQRPIPSHLPGFGSAEQLKRWRNFLGGKPGLDGQGFRRYGSRLSPDANGECPLVCPPCDDCGGTKGTEQQAVKRKRRLADHHAELRVPLGECNTRRDRTANPPGMQLSLTVVVSFHPNFITRVDRAYNIQCAYQEPERMLSTQIDVSPPPTIQISNQMQTPQCEYRIHGQASADQVRNVQVGDPVEHEWSCHGPQADHQERMAALFGLLIHDCFVEDGKSRRAPVLDSRGCSLDPLILPTPVYSANSLRATVLSNVAKFPDGDLIGFQCSITVCMRELGRCDGITPPNCVDSAALLNSDPNIGQEAANRTRERRSPESASDSAADWELHSPLLTVFDLTDQAETGAVREALRQRRPQPMVAQRALLGGGRERSLCVSVPMFAAIVSLGTFVSTLATGALVVVLLFRDAVSTMLLHKM